MHLHHSMHKKERERDFKRRSSGQAIVIKKNGLNYSQTQKYGKESDAWGP